MNPAHLHLALNHFPVVGIFGITLLLLIAIFRRSTEVARVSFGLFALLAVITVVVYLTGEAAEELVEGLPGISEDAIEWHEQVSLYSTAALVVGGVVALAALFRGRRRDRFPGGFASALLVLAVASSFLMAWTANTGGEIRHTEIVRVPAAAEADRNDANDEDDEDDDS